MLAIGYFYISSNDYWELKENGALADGRVVKYQLSDKDDNGLQFLFLPFAYIAYQTIEINDYWVTVEFIDASGDTHRFRNDFVLSSSQKSLKSGLKVYYDSQNPSRAIVYDFFYFYGVPLVLTLLGIFMVFMGYVAVKS